MKTVTYTKDGWDVTLTVRTASTRDRLQRNALMTTLQTDPAEGETVEESVWRTWIYANCIAATTIESKGERALPEKPTPDEFLDLPDELVQRWADACAEENQHWFPFLRERTETEKEDTKT